MSDSSKSFSKSFSKNNTYDRKYDPIHNPEGYMIEFLKSVGANVSLMNPESFGTSVHSRQEQSILSLMNPE